jgi:hypothetical protein
MSTTFSFTGTETYSVADVRAVMQNTFEDIIGFAIREMVTFEQAKQWIEDLTYTLNKKALRSFELQLWNGSGRFKSYRYEVNTYGVVSSGSVSGGIDYYSIPAATTIRLYADLNSNSPTYSEVLKELLGNRKWGNNGSAMQGTANYDRSYVSGTLQLKRSVIN